MAAENAESTSGETMSGADALARMLQAHGAGPIFMPGGLTQDAFCAAVAGLAMAHAPIVDPRAAAFAAQAYAEASGRVGLLSSPAGSDLTELAGGLLAAREAGSPVIALLPEPTPLEAGLLAGVCMDVIRVEPASAVPGLVRRAFIAATAGRPGPIALVVPDAVLDARARYDPADLVEHGRFESAPALRTRPDRDALQDAAERLARAERPIILAGPGVHASRAAKALRDLAEAWSIPVAHAPGGKGAVACTADLSAGLVTRGAAAATLLAEADLVLAVGGALDEIAAEEPDLLPVGAPILALEAHAEAIGRACAVAVPLWGDPRAGIEAMGHLLEGTQATVPEARKTWAARVAEVRATERVRETQRLAGEVSLTYVRLVAALSEYLPADGLLVVDPGDAARVADRGFAVKRCGRGLMAARASGAQGSAFPAAIGAALAAPGRSIVALADENGAARALGAVASARRLGLPVTLVVANAGAAQTRFDEAATGLGCLGLRARTPEELGSSLERALSFRNGPSLVDVVIELGLDEA